ncbi:lipid II:glycine glycyltransferase FemX [Lapillicoccus sp.]|uniref:lipid II:glycine glycyltransferase FemX n=1 Tax=Lapillicoccus sp. TaxID=1909287 RepID=UPI002F95B56D
MTEHLDFVRSCASASYLQCPSWGVMPPRWAPESVGWFDGSVLRGVALVLYRRVPAMGSLAYIGEGPVVDWAGLGPERILESLLAYLRTCGVFSVKIAPDLVLRRWRIETLRSVLRSRGPGRLRDVPPDEVGEVAASVVRSLREQGWTQYEAPGPGFGGQMHPRYRSHVPLAPDADPAERLDAPWRRNLRKASGSGVVVTTGGSDDLPTFHELYAETAARDGFPPLPLEFFERMWRSLRGEDPSRLELCLASREGRVYAAGLRTRVGTAVSYTHGASASAGREWRPSNAMQWQMLQDAHVGGADVYDLRGISDTLDPGDPLFGLLRFKTGLGGEAVEMVGEWDYPLRPVRHRLVSAYLDRRVR